PDEWVRKQYQKVGDKIPDRQFDELVCYSSIVCPGMAYSFLWGCDASLYTFYNDYKTINMLGILIAVGVFNYEDFRYSARVVRGELPSPKNAVPSIEATSINKYNQKIRPCFLVASAVLLGKAAGDAFGYFMFDEAYPVVGETVLNAVYPVISGLGFFGAASSMYLKDRDPKQFEKKPFWERAYDSITEKVKEYLPQPIPIPIPVIYERMEATL
ncbi:MAG: hypothetical protein AABX82_02820, partial [Nanoarchaeota archaeon]